LDTIIVVGLHGCGTRYISKCLHESGIPMWVNQAKSDHYEDDELLNLNINELETHGFNWASEIDNPKWSKEFIKFLQDYKSNRTGQYGFKAPRIALMIDAYAKVWPNAKWVCCIRNPIHSANSHIRNGRLKTITQGLKTYADNLSKVTGLKDIHYFNYDGDIGIEQVSLSKYLGIKVDLLSGWRQ